MNSTNSDFIDLLEHSSVSVVSSSSSFHSSQFETASNCIHSGSLRLDASTNNTQSSAYSFSDPLDHHSTDTLNFKDMDTSNLKELLAHAHQVICKQKWDATHLKNEALIQSRRLASAQQERNELQKTYEDHIHRLQRKLEGSLARNQSYQKENQEIKQENKILAEYIEMQCCQSLRKSQRVLDGFYHIIESSDFSSHEEKDVRLFLNYKKRCEAIELDALKWWKTEVSRKFDSIPEREAWVDAQTPPKSPLYSLSNASISNCSHPSFSLTPTSEHPLDACPIDTGINSKEFDFQDYSLFITTESSMHSTHLSRKERLASIGKSDTPSLTPSSEIADQSFERKSDCSEGSVHTQIEEIVIENEMETLHITVDLTHSFMKNAISLENKRPLKKEFETDGRHKHFVSLFPFGKLAAVLESVLPTRWLSGGKF